MPTVIDSLVVTLGLDPSGFTKGQKEAAQAWLKSKESFQRTGKQIEGGSKSADMFLGKLQGRALGLFAIFSAGKGIKDFTNYINAQNVAVGRGATLLDTSTAKLSAGMGISKATGGDANATAQSIAGLNQQLQNMSITGDSSILPFVRALGISLQGTNGKIVDAETALRRIAPALQRVKDKDGMGAATAMGRGLGLNDDLIYVLTQGNAALEKYMADQRKWGTISADQAKISQDLLYANKGLEQSFESLWRQITTKTSPSMQKLSETMTNLVVGAKDSGWVDSFFGHVDKLLDSAIGKTEKLAKGVRDAYKPENMTSPRKVLLAKSVVANADADKNKNAALSVMEEAFFKAIGKDNKLDEARAKLQNVDHAKILEKDRLQRKADDEALQKKTGTTIIAAMMPMARFVDWLTSDNTKAKPDGGGGAGSSYGGGTSVASHLTPANAARVKKDMEFLMSLGRSKTEAAAMVSQTLHESSGDANMTVKDTDGKMHGGLLSWSPERIRNFVGFTGKPFYDSNNKVIADREDQLKFLNHEFYGSGQYSDAGSQAAGRLASKAGSAGKAAAIMSTMGVRPLDTAGNERARAATAEDLVKKLEDTKDLNQLPLPGGPNYGASTAANWNNNQSVVRNTGGASSTTHIDKIEVNVPPGSDGKAIGAGIKDSLKDTSGAIHAETGGQ
jgi:hypothetical protein